MGGTSTVFRSCGHSRPRCGSRLFGCFVQLLLAERQGAGSPEAIQYLDILPRLSDILLDKNARQEN